MSSGSTIVYNTLVDKAVVDWEHDNQWSETGHYRWKVSKPPVSLFLIIYFDAQMFFLTAHTSSSIRILFLVLSIAKRVKFSISGIE